MRTLLALSTAAAVLLQQVLADPVQLTDSFATFRWNGNDAVAQESFVVHLDKPARIQITDYKNRGDTFKIFDNDSLLGETSPVDSIQDEESYAATPEDALKDERYSKGTFELAEGDHTITIRANGPYDAGTAAIRLIEEVNQSQLKKEKGGKGKKGGDWDDDDDWKGGKGGDWDDGDDWKGGKGGDWDDDNDWKGGKGGDRKGGKGGDWDDDNDWRGGKGGDWNDGNGRKGRKGGWGSDSDNWGQDGGNWGQDGGNWGQGRGNWGHDDWDFAGVDTSHTITLTRTKWVVERPTAVPINTEPVPEWINPGWNKPGWNKPGWNKPGWGVPPPPPPVTTTVTDTPVPLPSPIGAV